MPMPDAAAVSLCSRSLTLYFTLSLQMGILHYVWWLFHGALQSQVLLHCQAAA
jgi:hypothetical protein